MSSLLAVALLAAASDKIGLYPIALPEGQELLAERLEAQLHEGAAALPRVKAIDLVAKSACAPDEGECLAGSARKIGFDQMVSAQVAQTPHGYRFHVRAFAARDGALKGEHQGEVRGGPLDL